MRYLRYVKINQRVSDALRAGTPVVALESTIVAHGMPFPANLETALELEAEVERAGAVPATLAVIGGVPTIGLSEDELNELATGSEVLKLSRRDLAWAVAQRKTGATTVAATMMLAHRARIEVFATGGIGGVHRGANLSYDVSADLTELARTAVTVVCAGPKAILDLSATLEYLETLGVPVVGYQTNELPAFYSRTSGLPLVLRADRPDEVASFMTSRTELGIEGGVLVVNPIPQASEIPYAKMSPVIDQALRDAEAQSITGKALTPFLLDRLRMLTSGVSLTANIALVKNNARLAAEIAVARQKAGARHR